MKWFKSGPEIDIYTYLTVMEKLRSVSHSWCISPQAEEARSTFFQALPLEGIIDRMERYSYKKLYDMFCADWLLLDYRPARRSPTQAEKYRPELEGQLDEAERLALKNLIASYISPYSINSCQANRGRLENFIVPQFSHSFSTTAPGLMRGDVVVTRLLPGVREQFLNEPWMILLPSDRKVLFQTLWESVRDEGFNKSDLDLYSKEHTTELLRIMNLEVVRMEQDLLSMEEALPLVPHLEETPLDDSAMLGRWLASDDRFHQLRDAFLYFNRDPTVRLSWAYLRIREGTLVIAVPPGENSLFVRSMLPAAAGTASEHVVWSIIPGGSPLSSETIAQMVGDMKSLLDQDEEMTCPLLIPFQYLNYRQDQSRADFFARLSLELGKPEESVDPGQTLETDPSPS